MSNEGSADIFVRKSSGLKRNFTALDVMVFTLAYTLGSGVIFFTAQVIGEYPGASALLALLIDAIVLVFAVIVLWFLSIAIPRTGGQYTWISRIISPGIGYLVTLFVWIGYSIIMGDVVYIGSTYIGMAINITGHLVHTQSLISLGTTLGRPVWGITFGVVIVAFLMLIDMAGYKFARGATYIAFFTPFALFLIAIVIMLVTPHATTIVAFNSVFGTNAYNNVLSMSTAKGWTASKYLVLSIPATIAAVVPLMSSWSGVSHAGGWLVGEAKTPKKSMLWGTLIAYAVAAIAMFLAIISYSVSYGNGFVSRLFLVQSSYGVVVSIPLLATVIESHYFIPLAIVTAFIAPIFPIKDVLSALILQSRQLFAMAFDRLLPEKLTYVHPRLSSPIVAYLATGLTTMLFVYLSSPLGVGVFVTAGWYVLSVGLLGVFTSLAAFLLPYSRPDIYKAAESPANKTIAGIPIISIFGAASLASWMYLLGAAFESTLTASHGASIMAYISIVLAIILIMYAYFTSRIQERGIPASMIGKELPPI
ncbi:MAG: APC family permease [Thermoplasmatales archaeon]